ncbi:MAG: hypothetical protein ACXW4E_00565 [Anaerolineales bacterium]
MKSGGYLSFFVIIASGLLLTSCLLPGMIPLEREPAGPMPVMEKNSDKVIEVLNSNNYVRLEAFAQETYTEEDFSKPGTLTFTVKLPNNQPTYFSYGWCTTTEEILTQNFEHIKVKLSINGKALGSDVVHPITFTRPDGLMCLDYGVLMTELPAGEYELEAGATFDEKLNDGIADYAAGDYVFTYKVTVEEGVNTSQTPSPSL